MTKFWYAKILTELFLTRGGMRETRWWQRKVHLPVSHDHITWPQAGCVHLNWPKTNIFWVVTSIGQVHLFLLWGYDHRRDWLSGAIGKFYLEFVQLLWDLRKFRCFPKHLRGRNVCERCYSQDLSHCHLWQEQSGIQINECGKWGSSPCLLANVRPPLVGNLGPSPYSSPSWNFSLSLIS